jgi:quercetin 2,3-dioxygenase
VITRRPASARGYADYGWLETYHTFSCADYYDPNFMGFRALRVINEDRVQPAMGLGTHAHQDLEILTWVLQGGLRHRDSRGHGSTIYPGELQRVTAGTGVSHSEFNASRDDIVHFLQIWIAPSENGLEPESEQRRFTIHDRQGFMKLLASPDGRDGSVRIHQDVRLYTTMLTPGEELSASLPEGRYGWLQVARGVVDMNGVRLEEGDGAAISDEQSLHFRAPDHTELLLFDLA